jgi:hypothetical protein
MKNSHLEPRLLYSMILTARISVLGSNNEGEPTSTAEDESMEEPLTMGPPSRDPIITAATVESSPTVRLRTHHDLMATHIPPELELRDPGSGVWTRHHVSRGTRYGPFVGKLTPEPIDPRYAWEVSLCSTLFASLRL